MANIEAATGPNSGQTDWTADDWAARLAQVEATAARGEDQGDGTTVMTRADGGFHIVWQDGLESLREQVAETRGEVAELEQLWLR